MKRIKFMFAWYDFWIGFFFDRKELKLYFFPIPMFGIAIDCRPKWWCKPCGGRCKRKNITYPEED